VEGYEGVSYVLSARWLLTTTTQMRIIIGVVIGVIILIIVIAVVKAVHPNK
jgi:hypothetical protein